MDGEQCNGARLVLKTSGTERFGVRVLRHPPLMERWVSGQNRLSANEQSLNRLRRFESYTFRHLYREGGIGILASLIKMNMLVRFQLSGTMPRWLSGDSTALVRRDTNTGGSSPSLGTIICSRSPTGRRRHLEGVYSKGSNPFVSTK
jgi:hypothetical protein